MKLRKLLGFSLLFLSLLLLVGCEPKTKGDSFISKSQYFEVISGGGWMEAAEGDLNKNADLELRGKNMEKYALLLTDRAEAFESYNDWFLTVVDNNSENYAFEMDSVKDVKVGGYDAKYVEFEHEYNNYKMYMRIYFLQSKNYYSQFFLWTLAENKNKLSGEFDNMINSIYYYEN